MALSTKRGSKTQYALPESDPKSPYDSRVEGAFGDFVGLTPAEVQLAFHKELVNKIQWVIGSAYKKRYSGKNSPVTEYARKVVKAIIRDHGYQI